MYKMNVNPDNRMDEDEMESLRAFSIQSIQEEVKILDNDANWNQLLYKEA